MKKITIWTIFLVFLTCSDSKHLECNFDEFYDRTTDSCVKCPPCPAGEEIRQNCGYNKTGVKTNPPCSPCKTGFNYNDKEGGSCKFCGTCKDKNKITIKACTVKSDTVCGCPKGTFETRDGDCEECSYCCGENWEQSSTIESGCKKQGLGRCICRASQGCSGNCSSPTESTMTMKARTTTVATTVPTKTKPNTSPRNGQKHPTKRISTVKDIDPNTPEYKHSDSNNPKAQRSQKEKIVYPYLNPGWIVLICLGAVAVVGLVAVLSLHKQTRKRIHGFCCQKYAVLSPDVETTSALVVESHHAESAPNDPVDNATPIPPGEEPIPHWYTSSAADEVYCNCRNRENEDLQMECACTMDKSETSIEKLVLNSSSTETIPGETIRYSKEPKQERQTSTWRISPSTSTSSRLSCPQTSHFYCGTCSSSSNSVTPSSHSGRSTDRMSSSSNCATLPPSRERSPDPASSCTSPTSSQVRSPTYRCLTPSTCVSPASSRERSPIPPSLPSLPSHSSFSEDQEICNQSSEYAQSREPLTPFSVEEYDKELDRNAKKAVRENLLPTSGKSGKEGRSEVGRKSPSPKKGVALARNQDFKMKENWSLKHTGDTKKDLTLINTSDGGLGYEAIANSRDDIEIRPLKEEEGDCIYRPIQRGNEDSQHRCPGCCPLPNDSFFQLIDRERTCLKDAICKELNKSSDYKEAARYFRVDPEMAEYEASSNPSERVLDKIKALHPDLPLKEFEKMLREKRNKRLDIIDIIQNHHISCPLCKRNRFDTKA